MRARPLHRPAAAARPSLRLAALAAAASVLAGGLAGCGNKGDLYLSDPATDASGADPLERELDAVGGVDARSGGRPAADTDADTDTDTDDGNGESDDVRRRRGTSP